MESEPYRYWIEIFNNTISDSYKNERPELKKTSMLITALHIEIKKVQQTFEKEMLNLRQQLTDKDLLEKNVKISPATKEISLNEIKTSEITPIQTNTLSHHIDLDSPDIFINNTMDIQIISSNSSSDETTSNIDTSPVLLSKRKFKIKKHNRPRKNILDDFNKENSMLVESTPELNVKNCSKSNDNTFLSKTKRNKSTLTQMFLKSPKFDTPNVKENSKNNQMINDDVTILREDNSGLNITNLLDIINEDTNEKSENNENEDEMDSTQEVDEFSKAVFFDENSPDVSPKKKFKPMESNVEPIVRGKARKLLLKGFSCIKCRDFYANQNLSDEQIQKKIDECSKHRYKYKPPEDTYEGIWDMSIPEMIN